MIFLLDTDYLGILKRESGGEFDKLTQVLAGHDKADFFISIVSFHEPFKGWAAYLAQAKSPEAVIRGYERLENLLIDYAQAQVIPYDAAAADVFADLKQQGVRVGTMDLRIASIAIANGMTLLTRNTVDFERVSGLTFEDWI